MSIEELNGKIYIGIFVVQNTWYDKIWDVNDRVYIEIIFCTVEHNEIHVHEQSHNNQSQLWLNDISLYPLLEA